MDAIAEDLMLVRSTCVGEDEFSWGGVDDGLDAAWEVGRCPSISRQMMQTC